MTAADRQPGSPPSTARWLLQATLLLCVVLAVCVALANLGPWYRLQLPLDDLVLRRSAPGTADPRVVVVTIDDATLDLPGQRWPWPRGLLAELLRRIAAGAPAAVGVDLLLIVHDPADAAGEAALAAALSRITPRPVLLERLSFAADGSVSVAEPLPALREHAESGYYNFSPDEDGVVRRQRLRTVAAGGDRRAFAQRVHQAYLASRTASAPGPRVELLRIPFRGPPGTLVSVSAADVLSGRIPGATFRGRAVLVGATFSDAKDVFATPMLDARGDRTMPGVEIHAHVLSALLDDATIGELSPRVIALLTLLLLLVAPVTTLVRSFRAAAATVALALTGTAVGYVAWLARASDRLALPLVPLAVAALIGLALAHGLRRWHRGRGAGLP